MIFPHFSCELSKYAYVCILWSYVPRQGTDTLTLNVLYHTIPHQLQP